MKAKNLLCIFAAMLALSANFLYACAKTKEEREKDKLVQGAEFSVHFIDLDKGDSTVILLPENKTAVIDTGQTDREAELVKELLEKNGRKTIDYLIISNANPKNVGGVSYLAERFKIERAFVPLVEKANAYPDFFAGYNSLKERGVKIEISETLKEVACGEWGFCFLYPNSADYGDSPYIDLNLAAAPDEYLINNASAVVYFYYKGVRFLFMGDAPYSAENQIIENLKVGVYGKLLGGISLENIDVLKIANNGKSGSSSLEFLRLVNPKIAVISCLKAIDEKPSTHLRERLNEYFPQTKLLETDKLKTVSVAVDENGVVRL